MCAHEIPIGGKWNLKPGVHVCDLPSDAVRQFFAQYSLAVRPPMWTILPHAAVRRRTFTRQNLNICCAKEPTGSPHPIYREHGRFSAAAAKNRTSPSGKRRTANRIHGHQALKHSRLPVVTGEPLQLTGFVLEKLCGIILQLAAWLFNTVTVTILHFFLFDLN